MISASKYDTFQFSDNSAKVPVTLLFPADFDFETGRNHEEQDGADGEVEDIADQGEQFPPGVEALGTGQGDVDQEVHARDPANDRQREQDRDPKQSVVSAHDQLYLFYVRLEV